MESTSLNSQQNTNIFDKDVLIQKLWKNTKTIEELPYLKDIHSYQWFKNSLEENIENFELQNADNMTQLLIDEITDTIEREKNDRLIKFMQEKNIDLGIRISQQPLGINKNIISIPLYLVSEIDRLMRLWYYIAQTVKLIGEKHAEKTIWNSYLYMGSV